MSDPHAGPVSQRFAAASAAMPSAPGVSAERAAEIGEKRDRVKERAETHFEKHRATWTVRQYGELLMRDAPQPVLRPQGMAEDRKSHLMRAADYMVRQRQSNRLGKIERGANTMLGRGMSGLER